MTPSLLRFESSSDRVQLAKSCANLFLSQAPLDERQGPPLEAELLLGWCLGVVGLLELKDAQD